MGNSTLHEILKILPPGLAEAVADATREKTILDGMLPEHREAMTPAVRSIVRSGRTGNPDEKA